MFDFVKIYNCSFIALSLCAVACNDPGETQDPVIDTDLSASGSGDIGTEGVPDPEAPQPIVDGYCLPESISGVYGYRHHCGGNIELTIDGIAASESVFLNWEFGFGPSYVDMEIEDIDVYETPLVAACCGGPMDLQNNNASYTDAYTKNCLYDGVQQVCSGLPKWIEAMATDAVAADEHVKANYLRGLAKDLNAGEAQGECITALYETGAPLEKTTNVSWNFVNDALADIDIEINLLEILEIDYPASLAEVATCNSVLDNDEYVMPVLTTLASGASVDNFFLSSGAGSLTDNGLVVETISPDATSVLSVASSSSGDGELRTLALFGDSETVVVDGTPYTIENWNIRLVKPVSASLVRGTYTFGARDVTFVAGATYQGASITLVGTNVNNIVLAPLSVGGWQVSGFELEYAYNGDLWTYTVAQMDFI